MMRLEPHELYAPRPAESSDGWRTLFSGLAVMVFVIGGCMAGMVFT